MALVDIFGRLLLAALCAALIGFERESAQKAAGLRTHTLVGVGAALFTIVSITGFEGGDEGRVAAQVVTGIGFLGAGAIFREGQFVKGLTTAAGLWAVAAIGVAAGSGSWLVAVSGVVIILGVLYGLRAADEAVARSKRRSREQIRIRLEHADRLSAVLKFARKLDPDASQLEFKRLSPPQCTLVIAVDPDQAEMIAEMLAIHKGVDSVEILPPLYRKGEPGGPPRR